MQNIHYVLSDSALGPIMIMSSIVLFIVMMRRIMSSIQSYTLRRQTITMSAIADMLGALPEMAEMSDLCYEHNHHTRRYFQLQLKYRIIIDDLHSKEFVSMQQAKRMITSASHEINIINREVIMIMWPTGMSHRAYKLYEIIIYKYALLRSKHDGDIIDWSTLLCCNHEYIIEHMSVHRGIDIKSSLMHHQYSIGIDYEHVHNMLKSLESTYDLYLSLYENTAQKRSEYQESLDMLQQKVQEIHIYSKADAYRKEILQSILCTSSNSLIDINMSISNAQRYYAAITTHSTLE